MNERDKYLNIYNGEHSKIYETHNIRGKIGGGYGRICWGEGMLELMKQWQVRSLLDVGCGYGNFCNAATLFASRVHGLDIASVATGNVIDNPDIEFHDGQAKRLPLPDGAVEWVTSFDCLEHCLEDDIDDILSEFNRVATKGFALSISYEPCDFEGVSLHMTVKPESWWIDKLSRYGVVTQEGRVPITGVPYLICRKPVEKKIICYCAGGLSMRLKALASCDALAKNTGRKLAMVWQADDPLCKVDFSDLFSNDIISFSDDELLGLPSCKLYTYIKDVADHALVSGNQTLRKTVRKLGSTSIDELSWDDEQDHIIIFYGNQNDNLGSQIDTEFIHRLELVPKLQDRINGLIHELGINKNIIGVHARGTDYGIGVKPYALQMIKALEQNQHQRFLVCSEEETYEQQLKHVFKEKALIRPKSDWVVKKDSAKGWALSNIVASAASVFETVVDLYLLSRTDFRIYHESSGLAQIGKVLTNGPAIDSDSKCLQRHDSDEHRHDALRSKHVSNQPSYDEAVTSENGLKGSNPVSGKILIYYCCPDTHERSAGIARLYRHVALLHASGYPVCILHTENGFRRPDMPLVPVQYFDQIGPDKDAIFVIPEGMPKIMYRLKDHPGRRFVIALSWHYIFSALPDGMDWRHLNIERVLAVSSGIGRMVSWSMDLPVHIIGSSIDHQRYFHDPNLKQHQVSFIMRKAVNIDRLKRMLGAKDTDYINNIKWVGLDGLSEDDYAAQIRQSSLFISTSMAEGIPTSCLEAMAAGTIVAGYAAVGGNTLLTGAGPSQNCILAPNGDYVSLAYGLDPVLNDLNQGKLSRWAHIVENGVKTTATMTMECEQASLISFWSQFFPMENVDHKRMNNQLERVLPFGIAANIRL